MQGVKKGSLLARRFVLTDFVGRGDTGEVWRAEDTKLGGVRAVKLLRGDHASAECVPRLASDAEKLARLSPRHFVHVYEHGTHDSRPYIVMEWLEGEDLDRRLKRVKRLSAAEACELAHGIADGLTLAHEIGIVHGNVKPTNVFFARDGNHEIVKLLDFGSGQYRASTPASSSDHGRVMSTHRYASPELIRGSNALDPRSDLWSLAMILSECLTGTRVFGSLGELYESARSAPQTAPAPRDPTLPKALETWWARAAARDPKARFDTALAMVQSLATALEVWPEQPTGTRPPRTPPSDTPPETAQKTSQSTPPANSSPEPPSLRLPESRRTALHARFNLRAQIALALGLFACTLVVAWVILRGLPITSQGITSDAGVNTTLEPRSAP